MKPDSSLDPANLTHHLVLRDEYARQEPSGAYLPAAFDHDGFIHCTDDAARMAEIANLLYRDVTGDHVYLYIDKSRVTARVQYDDPANEFPHIYGPLNLDAVVAVRPAYRHQDGTFAPPDTLEA